MSTETFFSVFMNGMSGLIDEAIADLTQLQDNKVKHQREKGESVQKWVEHWMEQIKTSEPPFTQCLDTSDAFLRLENIARKYPPVQRQMNGLGEGRFPWPWTFPSEAVDSVARQGWIQFIKNFLAIDFLSTHRWEHVCCMIRKTLLAGLEKGFNPMLPTSMHVFAWRQLLRQFEYNQDDKRYGPLMCVVTDGHLEPRDQRNSPASKWFVFKMRLQKLVPHLMSSNFCPPPPNVNIFKEENFQLLLFLLFVIIDWHLWLVLFLKKKIASGSWSRFSKNSQNVPLNAPF